VKAEPTSGTKQPPDSSNVQLHADITAREESEEALHKAGALQSAIFNSANFSSIATDAKGIIQIFNVAAERMLGYTAAEVMNKIMPAELHDPQDGIARAEALSVEFGTPIAPGFDALVFKAARGIEAVYELTNVRKDGSRFPAMVSVTELREAEAAIIGYLFLGTDNTSRKQTEEALVKAALAAAELAAIQSAVSEAAIIVVTDLTGRIEQVNDNFVNISKYSREELIGQDHRLLNSGLHPKAFIRDLWLTITKGEVWRKDIRNRAKDGSLYWVDTTIAPVLNERGEPVKFIAVRFDITARKQAEQDLSEKARLLDLTQDAIIVRGTEGEIRYWNHGAAELYGWSREEALGKISHELLQTKFFVPVEEMLAELHRTNHWVGELIHTKRDGQRITVLVRKTLDRDSEGNPAAVLENISDITARKLAENALHLSAGLFSSLVEKAPYGMYVVDDQFRLQQVNARARPIFGNIQPLLGRDIAEIIKGFWGEEVGGRIADIFRHTLETGERYLSPSFTERRQDLDVQESYEWEAQRIILPDGRHAVVCYFADISERRALENSKAELAADLVRADRAKDEFLAMLAHELRNPLAPLRNAAEILQTPGASADEHDQAQRIIGRQIENMTRMIDDLLDVSRITEGKIELCRQPVALADILGAAASVARSGIAARRQELTISLPAEPIFLNADATRLDQVFGNLLGNACKYSDSGCHISLSAERAAGVEPPEVIVRVRDDGMGIAPELLPHIFDLFVQSTRSLDRAHGGLGIGLTLVQRLVKLHGGSVEARSEGLGCGSEFIVRLPILPGPVAVQPPPSAPAAPEILRRILIVDDNEDATNSMAMLQRHRGHETRTAFTGPEAVAAAAEFLPNVVLLDIGLPGMDGFEVARRLRAMPALADTFLVALTGYSSDEDRSRAREAGFDEYLVKPVDLDLLREWLRSRA